MCRRGTHIYYVSHIVNHSCDTSAYSTTTRTSRTARCTSFYEASFCPSVLSSSRSTQSTLSPRAPHSYARPYASSPQRAHVNRGDAKLLQHAEDDVCCVESAVIAHQLRQGNGQVFELAARVDVVGHYAQVALLAALCCPAVKAYVYLAHRFRQVCNNAWEHVIVQAHNKAAYVYAGRPQSALSVWIGSSN
ncbi:hypothetical protein EJ02DRAFT_452550 [Clathrospora elynae]|uniref:Uncharacterized protein n=1 Tax=Clathrospora elynae TaxID=706981 RepID=A0A6A5T0D7_9PLEO|nr:hypothetical protein EJ02DRAFT_452550 [Clathrospora elynae]